MVKKAKDETTSKTEVTTPTPKTTTTPPASPTPPAPTTPSKEETVVVEKSVLNQVLDKQQEQEDKITRLLHENERLTAVADKSRLAWWDQQHSDGALISVFRVGLWTDYNDTDKEGVAKEKIVLGWRMVKDEVRFDGKVLKEDQIFRLFLNEGEGKDPSEVDVNIFQFTRDLKRIKGEVVKEIKTNDGLFKRLRFEDGQELDFDVKFLNP